MIWISNCKIIGEEGRPKTLDNNMSDRGGDYR